MLSAYEKAAGRPRNRTEGSHYYSTLHRSGTVDDALRDTGRSLTLQFDSRNSGLTTARATAGQIYL
jgi:hypothetical protein